MDQIDLSETYSSTSDRKSADVERGVQKLELTEKRRVHLRAGSEINLTSAGKHNKRTSFRQSLAVCTERAQVGPVSSTCWVSMFTRPCSRNVLLHGLHAFSLEHLCWSRQVSWTLYCDGQPQPKPPWDERRHPCSSNTGKSSRGGR